VKAIEATLAGDTAPMLIDAAQASAMTGPPSIDGIGKVVDEAATEAYWQDADRARRLKSDWASARLAAAAA